MLIVLEVNLKASDLQHEMSVVKHRGDAKIACSPSIVYLIPSDRDRQRKIECIGSWSTRSFTL